MNRLNRQISNGVSKIDADSWDKLVPPGNPFLKHGFLATLEQTGCVGSDTGWTPRIVVLRDPASRRLVGVAPLYIKTHSAGEFVFDQGWANAAHRAGIQYYPKAVIGVPFTPVPGARLLVHPDVDDPGSVRRRLLESAIEFVDSKKLSSLHINFVEPETLETYRDLDLPVREGFQYHWANRPRLTRSENYSDFEEFIGELRSKKRSNIKRERRKAAERGVETEIKTGDDVTDPDLRRMFRYYKRTIDKFFFGNQYLNETFFVELGAKWADHIHLVQASVDGDEFGGAFNAIDGETLYGRYWGATRDIKFTHFEACYYSSIQWCIANQYSVFEGGSGGEHKFDRGFMPVPTYSAHYIRNPQLDSAVREFTRQEADEIEARIAKKMENTPFKQAQ